MQSLSGISTLVLIEIAKLYSDVALTRRFNYILIEGSSACVSLAFNIARYPRISGNKRSVKSPGQASCIIALS